jgi:hypothetical protein
MAQNPALRREVINLYKGTFPLPGLKTKTNLPTELLNLGKDYPQGFSFFRPRLHKAFYNNRHLEGEEEIKTAIKKGEFVKKEIEAL